MFWWSWNNIARELLAWMADASVRAVLLAILALVLVLFLRRSSTAQHTLWTLVLAGMLAFPFLRPLVPVTKLHLPKILAPRSIKTAPIHSNARPAPTAIPAPPAKPSLPAPSIMPLFLAAVYLAGVVLFSARLLAGLLFTRRAFRDTRTIHSELWEHYELIADAKIDLTLEESDSVRVPLTTGSTVARVILPADWRAWPAQQRTAVLAHELAHARRRDPLIALLAAVNKCVFWFHPLAWWLERRLAGLAEYAADDAALTVSFEPQAYARLLLESAAQLNDAGSRLILHSAAMGGPVVARRIRRILDVRAIERLKPLSKIGRAILLCLGAALIWMTTAVDVPRLVAQTNRPFMLTAEQAAALEQELASDPENEKTRASLLQYYLRNRMPDRGMPLVLWLIDHHPESAMLGPGGLGSAVLHGTGPGVRDNVKSRWLTQVSLHPNDARVLGNAATALSDSPEEEIDLLKRARELDSKQWTEPLAKLYSRILVDVNQIAMQPNNYSGIAGQIRNEVQSSNDIALVGPVAQHVVENTATAALEYVGKWDLNGLKILAAELVTHAQTLDPLNRDWADLMQGVDPAARLTRYLYPRLYPPLFTTFWLAGPLRG